MDKQIWYEVYFSESSPRITERLVVKETALMVTYETTSRHWHTRELQTHLNRCQKVTEHREFYQSRENAIDRLKQWCEGRASHHQDIANRLRNAVSSIKIEPLKAE